MQPAAVITGKILDNDGDPLPGVSVAILKYGASSPQRAVVGGGYTDDLGEFRAGNLRSGRYLIEAIFTSDHSEPEAKKADGTKETAAYPTYYPGVIDKSQAAPLELHAGDEVTISITLSYGPAYRVRGTIVGLPELTGSDVHMMVRPTHPSPWQSNELVACVKSDGSFDIPKLLPGEYRAMLFKMDGTDFHFYQAARIQKKGAHCPSQRLSPR